MSSSMCRACFVKHNFIQNILSVCLFIMQQYLNKISYIATEYNNYKCMAKLFSMKISWLHYKVQPNTPQNLILLESVTIYLHIGNLW